MSDNPEWTACFAAGQTAERLGDLTEARRLYNATLRLAIVTDPSGECLPATLLALGRVERALGDWEAAEKAFCAVLETLLEWDDPHLTGVIAACGELGHLRLLQGRYSEAEPLYREAVLLAEQAHGPESAELIVPLLNLAHGCQALGEHAGARAAARRALSLGVDAWGPDHPAVGECLHSLAGAYIAEGRDAAAEPFAARALQVWQDTLGAAHPKTRLAQHGLAKLDARRAQAAGELSPQVLP